jgi:hypothetical protein
VAVIQERKQRRTSSNVVPMYGPKRKGPKLVSLAVEVEQEVDAAITRMDRYAYRKANRGTATDPKDAA